MSTPFAFVPRAVESKYTKQWPGISRSSSSRSSSPDTTSTDSEHDDEDNRSSVAIPSSLDKAKGKEKAIESTHSKQSIFTQDIASLVLLALSDYNIWHDADLRWKLDACLSEASDGTGFVPINYLLRRSPLRGSLVPGNGQSEPSEIEVVKALRTHASHVLEVRMRLPSSSSVWYGTGKTSRKKDVGGYEVRRKDWESLLACPSRGWSRARWDDMTVYMECIPPAYRTIGGIARFAEMRLSVPEPKTKPKHERNPPVQWITLPPHYLDKPGDVPKCKAYALVTFSSKAHAEAILREWPWRRRTTPTQVGDVGGDPTVKEAHKYGFRTISKAHWDALNEEYLFYKQRIVDEMARTPTVVHRRGEGENAIEREPTASPHPVPAHTPARTTHSSLYPFDCLVFVRNVHPETNKTTLKSFFVQALQEEGIQHKGQEQAATGLDYVDYTKGMDTCYLRLASPDHTTRLMAYFDAQRKTQVNGLDATGKTLLRDDKPITMERIQGKREELYWEKVPENVRRQAVGKAIKAQRAPELNDAEPFVSHNSAHTGRRRKRPWEP